MRLRAITPARPDNSTPAQNTHTAVAPWTVVQANDQRRARLETIRVVLSGAEYEGKDEKAIGKIDDRIVQNGADHLAATSQG